jgi:hypothetical protein
LGLFDFSLLRTHFCLITKYSVEFRAALRGNFARGAHVDEDLPKGGPGSDNSAFRMTLAGRMPVTLVHAVHRKEDGDESLFRVVVATRLAENFVEHIERMSEPEVLLSRRENYSCEVPDQAKVIVAAIDTQVSWFEYLVVAGGARGEIWCLETGTSKPASRPMPKRCIT